MYGEADRVVLVTGCAGGIGHACVEKFLAEGWKVIGLDVQAYEHVRPAGFQFVQADIADAAALEAVCEKLSLMTDRLHSLVNNAAVQIAKPLDQCSAADFDFIMSVNVRAPFLLTKGLLSLLKNTQGQAAVVNVSSVHAVATSPNIGLYAASKGALLALTRSMAVELASVGIRANAVLPGAVDTGMLRAGLNRSGSEETKSDSGAQTVASDAHVTARLEQLASKTVNGRVARPEEIAAAIFFLASPASSFMTGQPLIVDGGATAKLSTE